MLNFIFKHFKAKAIGFNYDEEFSFIDLGDEDLTLEGIVDEVNNSRQNEGSIKNELIDFTTIEKIETGLTSEQFETEYKSKRVDAELQLEKIETGLTSEQFETEYKSKQVEVEFQLEKIETGLTSEQFETEYKSKQVDAELQLEKIEQIKADNKSETIATEPAQTEILQLENINSITQEADFKKLAHKFAKELEYEIIQTNNLKSINFRLEIAIKNLQNNKEYIYQLLNKKKSASLRINKLIITVKKLQRMLKQKNAIISRFNYNYHKLLEKTSLIINRSCIN